jgi:hypothetical protein
MLSEEAQELFQQILEVKMYGADVPSVKQKAKKESWSEGCIRNGKKQKVVRIA